MEALVNTSTASSIKLVNFVLSDEEYGVPIELVKEIIRLPEITPLPNAPEHILGVINLRGVIIPILSLRKKFDQREGAATEHKVMIVEMDDTQIGLEVDDVNEVIDIASDLICDTPPMASSINSDYIAGIGKVDGRLLIMLDLQTLFELEDQCSAQETTLL